MNREPFYGVYLDDDGVARSLLTGAVVSDSKIMREPFYGKFYDENGVIHDISELSGGGGGGVTPAQVQEMIDAALVNKDPIVATVASASTILFDFSEDGATFNFLGGTFAWCATHEHFGVVTISAQIGIPFVTGRLLILDISDESSPTLATKPIGPSMTFNPNEFVVGSMYREREQNVVYVFGGGEYKVTPT